MGKRKAKRKIDNTLDDFIEKLLKRRSKNETPKQEKNKQLSEASCSPNGKHDTPVVVQTRSGRISKKLIEISPKPKNMQQTTNDKILRATKLTEKNKQLPKASSCSPNGIHDTPVAVSTRSGRISKKLVEISPKPKTIHQTDNHKTSRATKITEKNKQLPKSSSCSPNAKHDTPVAVSTKSGRISKKLIEISPKPKKIRQTTNHKTSRATALTENPAKSLKEPVNNINDENCVSQEKIGTKSDKENKSKKKNENDKERHENYLRYGIRVPTYDEIVKSREKARALKVLLDNVNFKELAQSKVSPIKCEAKKGQPVISLNCTSLTPLKIKDMFYKNLEYAKKIFDGTEYSERHERFKNYNLKDDYTENDLRYSPSLTVFTVDQKKILLDLLHDEFDSGDSFRLNQYYFKVLLPEMCLKIFMDSYDMKKAEALRYLEDIPVEDFV